MLTFDDIHPGEVLTFVNTHTDGRRRARRQTTHTAKVTKITERTIFLDDIEATRPGLDGPRPVQYRITRSAWHERQVRRITESDLPQRGTSGIAQASPPAPTTVHTLVTVDTQGGPTRVHRAGCPDIPRDARRWHTAAPRAHKVVDRAGLLRPLVEDFLIEDPTLGLSYYDNPDEFHFVSCCPPLPWRAEGAAFGHQIHHADHPGVQQVVAALTRGGHTPATIVGDYEKSTPQEQANGFLAYPHGAQIYVAHLQDGHDRVPKTRDFHHRALAAYARTLTASAGITVLGRPLRVLRLQVTYHVRQSA